MMRMKLPRCYRGLRALAVFAATLSTLAAGTVASSSRGAPAIEFQRQPGAVRIAAAGAPVATYFYAVEEITRPFFAHVHAPGGVPVTRNHPPRPDLDDTDHGTAAQFK